MRRVTAALTALLLAGCAAIPDSGPVRRVDDGESAGPGSTRFVPAGPAAGAAPGDIVDGFIEAMLAFPADSNIAAAFLSGPAAEAWRPAEQTVVYEAASRGVEVVGDGAARAAVLLDPVAALDRHGRYRSSETAISHVFELRQERGEWRIVNPPEGLWVSERYFADHFRAFELAFFDATEDRLVSDPVHVVDHEQLPTRLANAVLAGPPPDRRMQAVGFVPAGTSLRGTVDVQHDGTAEVRLRQRMADLAADARDRMVAQLAATLLQVDGVTGVRVVAPGLDVSATGASINRFRPPPHSSDVYALLGGGLVQLVNGEVEPVDGPWEELEVSALAVAGEAGTIALMNERRTRIRVRRLDSAEPLGVVDGSALLDPVWEGGARMWVVEDREEGPRIRIWSPDGVRRVGAEALARWRPAMFTISPDGARYAIVQRTGRGDRSVRIGAVIRDAEGRPERLGGAREVQLPGVTHLTAIQWTTGTELAVLAAVGSGGPQPYAIRVDGSGAGREMSRPAVPTATASGLAVVGSLAAEVYVADAAGVWTINQNRPWQLLEDVRLPTRAR